MDSVSPLVSTIADLTAAKLIAYVPPPPPGQPLISPSTDSSVYMGGSGADNSYLKLMNEQSLQKYAIDKPNQAAAARFSFLAYQWQNTGKNPTALPPWPQYVYLDQNAFDSWWAQFNSNLSGGAPPMFFIKPLPTPPPVQIVAAGVPPPPAVTVTDGPIGAPVPGNPGYFLSAGDADTYPDSALYVGPTGAYQKHIFQSMFTNGALRILWQKLN